MNPVIKPDTINILSGMQGKIPNTDYTSSAEAKPRQTRWNRFKAWVSEVCETFRPVVEMLASIVSTVALFLNAGRRYKAYRNREKAFAC